MVQEAPVNQSHLKTTVGSGGQVSVPSVMPVVTQSSVPLAVKTTVPLAAPSNHAPLKMVSVPINSDVITQGNSQVVLIPVGGMDSVKLENALKVPEGQKLVIIKPQEILKTIEQKKSQKNSAHNSTQQGIILQGVRPAGIQQVNLIAGHPDNRGLVKLAVPPAGIPQSVPNSRQPQLMQSALPRQKLLTTAVNTQVSQPAMVQIQAKAIQVPNTGEPGVAMKLTPETTLQNAAVCSKAHVVQPKISTSTTNKEGIAQLINPTHGPMSNTIQPSQNSKPSNQVENTTLAKQTISQSSLTTTQTGLTTCQTGVTSSQTGLTTSQTGLTTSQTRVTTSQTGLTTSQTGLTTSQTSVTTPQTGLTTSQTGLTTSQTSVTTSETGLTTLQTGLTTSRTSVSTSRTGLTTSQTSVSTSQTGLTASQNSFVTSKSSLPSQNTRIDATPNLYQTLKQKFKEETSAQNLSNTSSENKTETVNAKPIKNMPSSAQTTPSCTESEKVQGNTPVTKPSPEKIVVTHVSPDKSEKIVTKEIVTTDQRTGAYILAPNKSEGHKRGTANETISQPASGQEPVSRQQAANGQEPASEPQSSNPKIVPRIVPRIIPKISTPVSKTKNSEIKVEESTVRPVHNSDDTPSTSKAADQSSSEMDQHTVDDVAKKRGRPRKDESVSTVSGVGTKQEAKKPLSGPTVKHELDRHSPGKAKTSKQNEPQMKAVKHKRVSGTNPWTCALCGKVSFANSLGCLYGPYDGEVGKDSAAVGDGEEGEPHAKKRRGTNGDEVEQELWFHGECIVWSPGVYALGDTLAGYHQVVADAQSRVR